MYARFARRLGGGVFPHGHFGGVVGVSHHRCRTEQHAQQRQRNQRRTRREQAMRRDSEHQRRTNEREVKRPVVGHVGTRQHRIGRRQHDEKPQDAETNPRTPAPLPQCEYQHGNQQQGFRRQRGIPRRAHRQIGIDVQIKCEQRPGQQIEHAADLGQYIFSQRADLQTGADELPVTRHQHHHTRSGQEHRPMRGSTRQRAAPGPARLQGFAQ